jgi:WD40 repeat protein
VETGQVKASLWDGSEVDVYQVALSSDGKRLLAAIDNTWGEVQLWDISTGQPVTLFRNIHVYMGPLGASCVANG